MSSLYLFGPAISPYVRAVRLYAHELGLPLAFGMAPSGNPIAPYSPDHLALNPFGKFPILLDGDFSLPEVTAICTYLDDLAGASGRLAALSSQQRATVLRWTGAIAIYGRLYTMDGFMLELVFPQGDNGRPRLDVIRGNLPRVREFLAVIERQLAASRWIAGEQYSMADSLLTPFLDYLVNVPPLDEQGVLLAPDSACRRYLDNVRERDTAKILQQG
ncbi:glutathione S-transferase family protein [Oceanobacter sp. 4_MG-2023]|uniref:glutathione S-transferase family protein n=1 Tax=Oceanobacter sp. 4_MG-2023 TaxID=3062623 RepID=UPI002732B65D|nr:glutathione S-transferase family protein [Oceanobacter sp. 4_MG-2023]MDP2547128.1 glutathione S-transferase family protein [Oceanobacter sp. 4_MG-2023]